jgi:hypothetical protein
METFISRSLQFEVLDAGFVRGLHDGMTSVVKSCKMQWDFLYG